MTQTLKDWHEHARSWLRQLELFDREELNPFEVQMLDTLPQLLPSDDEHMESWYTWRVLGTVEGEDTPRLFVPWSDPHKYEFPFDLLFESPEAAHQGLIDWGADDDAHEEGWILCHMTLHRVEAL